MCHKPKAMRSIRAIRIRIFAGAKKVSGFSGAFSTMSHLPAFVIVWVYLAHLRCLLFYINFVFSIKNLFTYKAPK